MVYTEKQLAMDMKKAKKGFENEVSKIKRTCEQAIIDFNIDLIVEHLGEHGEEYRPILESLVGQVTKKGRRH